MLAIDDLQAAHDLRPALQEKTGVNSGDARV